ncbi:hypothetical protein CDAR_563811 [Caerostris darwini]|uniref:Uncharacterized protein n=1 Tax=Caerostris darwini TaxID=1538125 RepID=A0AAV4UZ18_9ARAC|nr:hypothetical protein CDAR_563811 [Caerostris darwini]
MSTSTLKSATHSNNKLTSVKPAHISDRPSTSLSLSPPVHISSTPNLSSSSSATNLPATPRYTNYKIKSGHRKKNFITNPTPSMKCNSPTSNTLPKFKKYFHTKKFGPLAHFVTPDGLETESPTEHLIRNSNRPLPKLNISKYTNTKKKGVARFDIECTII